VKKVSLLFLGFVALIPFSGFSQQLNNLRKKAIAFQDTIHMDTLSLVPGTIAIKYDKTKILDTSCYKVDEANSRIILNTAKIKSLDIKADTLYCTYRVFPYLFSQTLQHKDTRVVHPTTYAGQNAFMYSADQNGSGDPFDLGTLTKSGSISRGVTFGNNQNLSVNSNLNLQLEGKLSNNINVLVAATDNNLPIQPEGNTQQLQDFDKVFVKLYNKHSSLIAGDYELGSPNGYFMKYYKKAQGGLFATDFIVKPNKDSTKDGVMRVSVGGGISKGQFAENNLVPIDGNAGPYRLTGTNGETFIVVLSGSERVFLDGQLLQRGQNNDYTIDYNAAQVTFTPKHLISVSSHIVVDFQYSDLSYVRTLVHASTEYRDDKLALHFNLYSEQDAKYQQLTQSLSPEQEQFLASIGNNIQNAFVPGAVSTAWNSTQVFYRKVDTIVGSFNDTVYVYSTDSLLAHYTLSFSQVPQGQGDYVQIQSAANGSVFQWKVPINGVRQGNYIAQILLITPKKKQMLTSGMDYKFSKNTYVSVEGALTNNDINTFSNIDKGQNVGYAGKALFHNTTFFVDSTKENKGNVWRLQTNFSYEGVQKYFSPIERYRSVDFDRSWNQTSDSIFDNENIMDGNLTLANKKNLINYDFQAFLEGGAYNATKHSANLKLDAAGFLTTFNGSLLQTKSVENTSNYYKELAGISHKLFFWIVGLSESSEKDIFRSRQTDSIVATNSNLFEQASNYQFYQWSAFIKTPDTAKRTYGINYTERTDFGADIQHNEMVKSLYTRDVAVNAGFIKNPKSRFKANVTYHIMQVLGDSAIAAGQTPVNALVGQAEYDAIILKGFINSSTYYQAGSGLQPKEEYTYVQVAQGQGVYAWTDFNNDGIKQLNEFYPAPFPDQADYIRVYTPTTQYIKTSTSGFTETFSLKPAALWGAKKGILGFISRFSEQLAVHVDKKTTTSNLYNAYNPFLQQTSDSNIVGLNSSIRNTIFFNQLNPKFGADYTYSDTRTKTVLEEDGAQSRQNLYQQLHARCNFTTKWMIEGEGKLGDDISSSQYFSANNFYIAYYELQPKVTYQPSTSFRVAVLFTYTDKSNYPSEGGGLSTQKNYGVELKYNVLKKGSLTASVNFIQIDFNGEATSPLGFEMLQGLNVGNNYTWGISYQCNLSGNIQLSLAYNGRDSQGSRIINTGTAQVRAFF
jgi:hypothetical protein